MFFFGTREKVIKSGKISNIICNSCKETTKMHYIVEAKYFHLYWIPMFPYKKKTYVECDVCEEVFEKKGFSESIKNKLQRENELKPAKSPIWMFSGLIILAILIPLALFQSSRADSKKEKYNTNPKIGDVYFLNCIPSKYTTMKIASIEKDTVHFILNDTSVTKFMKVFTINKDHYYSNKAKSYSKLELVKMFKKDSIYSIERD